MSYVVPVLKSKLVLSTSLFFATLSLRAALAPYAPDGATLHLWHLDEPAPPSVNAVSSGTNLVSLGGGATLNQPSFPGFGTALNTADGGTAGGNTANQIDAHFAPRTLANNGTDNVAWQFADPVTGAFTFEALLWIGFDPLLNLGGSGTGRNSPMQILSGEQDGTGGGVRSWQFRIDPAGVNPNADGFTSALPQPAIEFINVNNGSPSHFIALIPTNGVDAIASNQWYHVAVTYDGNAGTAENLRLYWTRLEANRTSASLLASRQMNQDLNASGAVDFCVGNTGRTTPNNNFIGSLDEIRISSVARAATNFYWQPAPPLDTDQDDLDDAWELTYFTNLTAYAAADDPDLDQFDNLAELTAGSIPTNILSTPLDVDADGLPDTWEQTYFGSRAALPGSDPDNDGFNNLTEYNDGTNPTYGASNATDKDADGLPDAWEQLHFASLAAAPGQDPDGDGFSNLQEFQVGTSPTAATSHPQGPRVTFIPLDDANPDTSEYGYAGTGNGNINAVSFTRSSLITVSNQQFIAWYYRHQDQAGHPSNNRIAVGRRSITTNNWEVFFTPFQANDINDDHDVVSFGIDGEGYLHMSWGMHGNPFHYARSTQPATGTSPIVFGPDSTMTGAENNVTYPQFLTLPNGDLLYLFREGGSGDGDTHLNRWSIATHSWTNVHFSGSQQPFIRGTPWTPDYNAYPNMPQLGTDGVLHLTWNWRYNADSPAGEAGYQTNHDSDYARSTNGGLTWLRQDGTPYTLPINEGGENENTNSIAEKVLSIPEGYSLINQASMCLDSRNRPAIASWWAPGTGSNNFRRQYMVAFPDDNNVWHARQVSQRTNDPVGTKFAEGAVRDLGRPVIVADREDRLIVIYRDNFNGNGLTVAHSLPRVQDPQRTNWTSFELTTNNLGRYETQIDWERWQRDQVLHLLYQPSQGLGYTAPANNASQIGVLEWNAGAYFAHRPALQLSFAADTNAVLRFNSQPGWNYRLQTSTNLIAWETLAEFAGTGRSFEHVHTNGQSGDARYWRVWLREGGFSP